MKNISGFQSSFQDIGSPYKIHHYHLTALSLIGGNFKEQPGTELQKKIQRLNFKKITIYYFL